MAITSKPKEQDFEVTLYCAVDYLDCFQQSYIGRVISAAGKGFWTLNFLHQHSEDDVLYFYWLKQHDTDIVHKSCIIYILWTDHYNKKIVAAWITLLTILRTSLVPSKLKMQTDLFLANRSFDYLMQTITESVIKVFYCQAVSC